MITTKPAALLTAQGRLARLRTLRDRTRGDVLLQAVTHLRTVELLEECRTIRAEPREYRGAQPIKIDSLEINGKTYGVIGPDFDWLRDGKDPYIRDAQLQLANLRQIGRYRANYRLVRTYMLLVLREFRRGLEAAR